MRGKLGISAIVAVVMTVLITVAGVTIIWVAIVPMVSEGIEFSELDGRVSIVSSGGWTVYDAEKDVAIVQVKRDVDEGVMNRIKISFVIDGNSVSSTVVAPESGQTKTYTFDLSEYNEPRGVSVAPIFVSDSGKEKEGNVQSKVDVPSGNIQDVDADVYELDKDYFYEMPMTGLVSWWKFDGDANDSVGENDGECSGEVCPIYENGVGVFDGVNDYIEIIDDVDFDFTTEFSVFAWIKTTTIENADGIVTKYYSVTDKREWALVLNDVSGSDAKLQLTLGSLGGVGTSTEKTTAAVISNSLWYNIGFTYSEGVVVLYVNGSSVASSGGSHISTLNQEDVNIDIGTYNGLSTFFNGLIDNVMIFNRVLSDDEITAIYETQKKGKV